MKLGLHKWPQGRVLRYLAAATVLSYVAFAAYKLYEWKSAAPLPFVSRQAGPGALTLGVVGAAVLFAAGSAAAFVVAFVNPRVSDYLIAVEGELRKVYWPRIKPWFKRSTELWGSTYVVISVVAIMGAFVFGVDQLLSGTVPGFYELLSRLFR